MDNSDNSVDKSDKDGREDLKPAEKPISLAPLKFEEAVEGLLKVRPTISSLKKGKRKDRGGARAIMGGDAKPEDEPKKTSTETPVEVEYHYIKGNQFRVIHVDGGVGGITQRGFMHLALYSERLAIPKKGVRKVEGDDPTLGPEDFVESLSGVVREVEVDLLFDERTAIEIRDWLSGQINIFAEVRKQVKMIIEAKGTK